jgi:hypothetical protein
MKAKTASLILGSLFTFSCDIKTRVDDVKLSKNQVVYHFEFHDVDEVIETQTIRPHMVSLTGNHIRTKRFKGIIGDSLEVIRIVEFEESKNEDDLKKENREVLESLRKKVSFNVEIRVGK